MLPHVSLAKFYGMQRSLEITLIFLLRRNTSDLSGLRYSSQFSDAFDKYLSLAPTFTFSPSVTSLVIDIV